MIEKIENTRETVRKSAESVVEMIKQNPFPSALIGVGLGWLFSCSRGTSDSHLSENGSLLEHPISGKVAEVTQTLQRSVGEVQQQAERFAERAQHSLNDTIDSAKGTLGQYKETLKARGQRVEGYLEQTFHDNPWVVGAAVLAAGTVIGLAIPISRREDKWMGNARDSLLKDASVLAQDAILKVEDAARRAAENVARPNAGRPSGSPTSIL